MAQTARRTAIATLVALAIIVAALALWKIKAVIALLFLGFVVAAAMRPGVDWLHERARLPRGVGVLLHYLVLVAMVALFLWLIVPPALTQIEQAVGTGTALHREATHSTGIKHEVLTALEKRLRNLPSGSKLIHPALSLTRTAFEALVGIFFLFAVGAYWIFERDRAVDLVASLLPRERRKTLRDTWWLIDLRLGAFVRGQVLLIGLVSLLLGLAFWLDGLPYWILIAVFAGVFEIVPVIGPLAAGALAVGVGLTVDWHTALGAGIAVLVLRQLEDYVIVPRVLGHAVGLSPLVVLVSVTTVGILFGSFYVLLAVPIAAVLATLVDVLLRDRDPAEEDVPAVLFPAKDAEAG